jgi:hypothetical protein
MTERMQSGGTGKDSHPYAIVEMLEVEPVSAAVLALCCAEQLSKIAESLAESLSIGRAVRSGLDLGWSAVVGPDRKPEAIGRAISDLYDLLESARGDPGKFRTKLEDAICAAIYALEAVREGNSTAALNAVSRCRDVYFQLATKTWPRLSLSALKESPIMQQEVSREVSNARMISAWGQAISAEKVAALRQAANVESERLVRLMRADTREADEAAALNGQEPLF